MQLTNKCHMPSFPLRNVQCLIQWWLVDNWANDCFQCMFPSFCHHIYWVCVGPVATPILWTVNWNLSSFIVFGMQEIVVGIIPIFNAHGWFYSNLSIAITIFLYFIFFHCFSKRYKLRKRDDIVPIHLFTEDFFEKELRGQERLDEEWSSWKNSWI